MDKEITKKDYEDFLKKIVHLIEKGKQQAFSAVNRALIQTYWNIGKEIVEKQKKLGWGVGVVEKLSADLKASFPDVKGYSKANLWNMKRFYETYEKLQTLSGELIFNISWSNHILIMDKTRTIQEKEFYIKMAIKERWSYRELNRQIDSSLFERFVSVDKPNKVLAMVPKTKELDINKHFKDEYVLEFLDLEKDYTEKELQNAILDNIKSFFLEFGKDFAFLGQEYPIYVGNKEYRIDLLFFHRALKCLVAIELKVSEFKPEYVGKMQFYLNLLDEKVRNKDENLSVGLILCKSKNHEEVRFALAKTLSPIKVAAYIKKLPDKKLILKRLEHFKIKNTKKND